MGKISKSGIAPQQQIKSEHLIRIIDALSGESPNTQIEISGSVTASYFVGNGSLLTNLPTASINDASSSTKGILRLTGDLGGTANSPTTPTAVHKTGDETITDGQKNFINNSDRSNIVLQNNSTGQNIVSINNSIGDGFQSINVGSGNSITSNGTSSSTGFNYVGQDNGTDTFTVDKFGKIIAESFEMRGGLPTQFLKADGTKDSNTYLTSNNLLTPYKVYTALLTQIGTDAPTATILENTLGSITYNVMLGGDGRFRIRSDDGLFTENKTFIVFGNVLNNASGQNITITVQGEDVTAENIPFVVNIDNQSNFQNNGLLNTPLEIRVYN